MQKELYLATAYIQIAHKPDQFVALASFVQNREEFELRIQSYFSQQPQTLLQFQLAPIPANLFFQRHGYTWLLHQISIFKEDDIQIIPLNSDMPQPDIKENIEYLHCHVIDNVIPLDMQFGRIPDLFAPEAISHLLWPDFPIPQNLLDFANRDNPVQFDFPKPKIDEKVQQRHLAQYGYEQSGNKRLPPLNVYFVLDANKMPFFLSLSLKAKMKSLFQGKFGDDTAKIAPYLIEVIRDEDHIHTGEMMGLFSLKSALHKFNWEDNLGIFIHSYADFDTVYRHLRKFPVVQDEREKWLFFRFYDPKVLRNYLTTIAKYPAKLHKFFGYDDNIIYAFGSGFGDSFHYYTLKALPEKTLPAAVIMSDWEMNGFKKHKWLETREYLTAYALQEYPQFYSEENRHLLVNNLDEGFDKGYTYELAILQYAVAKQSAVKNRIDFTALEEQVKKETSAPLEITATFFSLLNLE